MQRRAHNGITEVKVQPNKVKLVAELGPNVRQGNYFDA